MSREEVIEKTIAAINKMPVDKGEEVADFAEYMLNKIEERNLQKGIEHLIGKSDSFKFLKDEEDLYTTDDLIEKY
jgi:hypothetical protein